MMCPNAMRRLLAQGRKNSAHGGECLGISRHTMQPEETRETNTLLCHPPIILGDVSDDRRLPFTTASITSV